jgi:hypothetical protein
MMCKDRKNDFCAKAKSVIDGMSDPAGYDAAVQKHNQSTLTQAAKDCGLDMGPSRTAACNKSIATKNWQFARSKCPQDIAKLRVGKCDVPGKLSEDDQTMCDNTGGLDYTAIQAKKGNAKPQPAATPSQSAGGSGQTGSSTQGAAPQTPAGDKPAGDKPADPAKGATTTDKLKEGADKLKKFLKF